MVSTSGGRPCGSSGRIMPLPSPMWIGYLVKCNDNSNGDDTMVTMLIKAFVHANVLDGYGIGQVDLVLKLDGLKIL